ncbi:MAG: DUF5060 domain-containing protein, partial [Acidobacteriaceae bacterium]|nr:DUF5060 domain-containing protein [Acidobacteriaceae bacterium]
MRPCASVIPAVLMVIAAKLPAADAPDLHVWQKQQLTFTSQRPFKNAYTDVRVWVDLKGPGFAKRVYGFWDGGNTFRVRVLATAVGRWTWISGSDPETPGVSGRRGAFVAQDWTEAEKQANPLRRGFLRPTANHHALETADGTPFLVIGDTWYSTATNRFRWYDTDTPTPIGREAGFKDYVRFRK